MDGLRFEAPLLLTLLGALPVLALVAWPPAVRAPALRFGTIAAASGSARTWRVRFEPALVALRLLAAALLVVALARPQRGEASVQARGEGIDVVLAFDVSSSMTQPYGAAGTRIEAAKDVLADFVAQRKDDRVALVAFQGSSITLSPLTTDYAAVEQAVRSADLIDVADGTAIGTALGESVNALRDSTAASRIVILLTDGENNAGVLEPLAAARIAERLGVRVYTVGVVGGGGQVAPGRSTLNVDEESLRRIGEVTGGSYSRAEDPRALGEVYARISELETSTVERRVFTRFDEIAPYFLAAAAAALAAEMLLRSTLFRRFV